MTTRTPKALTRELNRRCQSFSQAHTAYVEALALKKPTFPKRQFTRLVDAETKLRTTFQELDKARTELKTAEREKVRKLVTLKGATK